MNKGVPLWFTQGDSVFAFFIRFLGGLGVNHNNTIYFNVILLNKSIKQILKGKVHGRGNSEQI